MRLAPLTVLLASAAAAPAAGQDMACPYNANMKLETRRSPLDSLMFDVGGHAVKICYGRPSLRGRTMIGAEAVPFGTVWRTGANETSKFITTAAVRVGTIEVPAGMYALYTQPGESEWDVIVNRSYEQWGRENTYTDAVKAQELGRVKAAVERVENAIEQFTIRAEPQADGSVHLVLEWEHTRIRVPVTAG
jgi:hypothetical protein